MNKLTTWFMSKFILNGMKARDDESLGTKNSTNFMNEYTKAIKSTRADIAIVLISAVVCLVVIWDSLGGTVGFKIISCILLMLLMNYINIRILRSDMKSLVVGYIKSLDSTEKLEFCSFFNMVKNYDKKSGEAYYDVYKHRVKEAESIESVEKAPENEQAVVDEKKLDSKQMDPDETAEKEDDTEKDEIKRMNDITNTSNEMETSKEDETESCVEIEKTTRNKSKNNKKRK